MAIFGQSREAGPIAGQAERDEEIKREREAKEEEMEKKKKMEDRAKVGALSLVALEKKRRKENRDNQGSIRRSKIRRIKERSSLSLLLIQNLGLHWSRLSRGLEALSSTSSPPTLQEGESGASSPRRNKRDA